MKKTYSLIEVGIMILAIFAFAYLIHEATPELKKALDEPLIPLASAQSSSVCCEKMKAGAYCQDTVSGNDCDNLYRVFSESCDQTDECKLGCCYDEEEGTADKGTPKLLCKGRFIEDRNCNTPEAKLGCCFLGTMNQFVTEKQCEKLSATIGVGKDWKPDVYEAACTQIEVTKEVGACITRGQCKVITKQECDKLQNGTFYKENDGTTLLCTAPQLHTNCTKTTKTICIEGRDEVFFQDSCGNRANIYDSSKYDNIDYWTKVYTKDQSCNPKSGNENSKTCGNCHRQLGGYCSKATSIKPIYGDNICKQTWCDYKEGKKTQKYQNGESWCVYEGKVDNGDDVVGSRHYKKVCQMGEIIDEPCADFRQEICVESDLSKTANSTGNTNGSAKSFNNAACIPNNWRECTGENAKAAKDCNVAYCMKKGVHIDMFNFDVCVPRFPPGWAYTKSARTSAESICKTASQTCKVIYTKKLFEGCTCDVNCDCETSTFTDGMNEICRRLGDCGAYVNIAGKVTTGGYSISGAPGVTLLGMYKKNAEDKPGQTVEVDPNLEKYIKAAGLKAPDPEAPENKMGWGAGALMAGIGLGVAGIAYGYAVGTWMGVFGQGVTWNSFTNALEVAFRFGPVGLGPSGEIIPFTGMYTPGTPFVNVLGMGVNAPFLAAVSSAAIAAGAAFAVVSIIGALMGLPPEAVMVAAGTGALASVATVIVIKMWFSTLGFMATTLWAAGIGIVVGILMLVIFKLMGIGEVCKEVDVAFKCKPWVPPTGSADCDKCNAPGKICSEYRCKSLGAACEFKDQNGKIKPTCIAKTNDGTSPSVSANTTISTDKLKYILEDNGVSIENINGGCMNAYETIDLGVITNEDAVCKMDLNSTDFNSMRVDFGDTEYQLTHTTPFFLPEPAHAKDFGSDWNGNMTMYVKCQDAYGNENLNPFSIKVCVNAGPDITPPVIKTFMPPTRSSVKVNATSKAASIYTNEPADCKWSLTDQDYESMENNMSCANSIGSISGSGYPCLADFIITNNGENKFYIRCKDQPWLTGENATRRNPNSASTEYVIIRTDRIISIDSLDLSPEPDSNNEIPMSNDVATIKISVRTSGGGSMHSCKYSFSGYDWMIDFYKTYSTSHEQEVNNMVQGMHNLYVECTDETGDKAKAEKTFTLTRDVTAPSIIRILPNKIVTNEEAECRASNSGCGFNFDEGTSMQSGFTTEHNAPGTGSYGVICKDSSGNSMSCQELTFT